MPEREGMPVPPDTFEFDYEVLEASSISARHRESLLRLFRANYRDANPAFVDKSLSVLRYVAIARHEGKAIGFAMGESRRMDLPRLPDQLVSLAGLACIDPEFRRRGLFFGLSMRALAWNAPTQVARRLFCGRMAHPAALRSVTRLAKTLPSPGIRPTAWQQEVGRTIADTYGVFDFDPETFVCIGDGRPIGYPRIDFEVEPEEWEAFARVNRDRGDALLAIAWLPDSPPGW
jgi:hypothetical protein